MLRRLLPLVALGSLVLAATALGSSQLESATTNVSVTAGKPSELRFMLSKKTVPKGTVVFKVTNRGTSTHDFRIGGRKTPLLRAGKTATLKVALAKPGRHAFLCTVAGHAAAGMKGVLLVK
jgi:uncharacterized cupredoxin-like copper-binding protein